MSAADNVPFWLAEFRQNRLPYSAMFDQWTQTTVVTSADVASGPDGVQTADAIVAQAASGNRWVARSLTVNAQNAEMHLSVYARYVDHQKLLLQPFVSGASGAFASFDVQNGTVTGMSEYGSGISPIGQSMLHVGGGWYRCVLHFSVESAATMFDAVGFSGNTTSGSSALELWGAQHNGAELGPHAPTSATAASSAPVALPVLPDFDYAPATVKEESVHRTPGGGRYSYRWGSYRRFSVPVSWVGSAFRARVNSWWDGGAELTWTEDGGATVSSVRAVGEEEPVARVEAPYLDQFGGTIELETY